MLRNARLILGLLGCVVLVGPVAANPIAFDDLWADLGQAGDPATYYQASDGATFSGVYFGAVGGNGNGDPGNWNLEGTNGSAFLGCNSGDSCSPTVTFDSLLSDISLDVGLPGFNWAVDLLVEALLGNAVVNSQVVNLVSAGDPGPWASVSFSGSFDGLRVTSSFSSGFAFAVDNVAFDAAAAPEPMTLALVGVGLAGLGFRRRAR